MRIALGLVSVVIVACGGDDGAAIPADCNPLGASEGCSLPFPSSVYLAPAASSPTGFLVDLPPGALPASEDGIAIDTAWMNQRTGFSAMSQILLTFPGGVDDGALVFHDDIAASLTDASPTVIVDMTSGQRVAHFAEVDANDEDGILDDQIVYLRPAARLAGNTRYAVAIRKTLRSKTGGELPITAGFRAMLDGRASGHARLDATLDRYPEIFAALDTAGIPRDDLVVAFDFVTADDDSIIADPLAARDAAMDVVGDGSAVAYTITLDESPDSRDPTIARRVMIDYTTPQVADGNGFFRSAGGMPVVMGERIAPASILIPSCATPTTRAGIVIYGHGFFGSLEESMGSYARLFAQDTCNVVIGGLWYGMSMNEITDAILGLNDLNRIKPFTERIWQGVVDFMTLIKLARGKLATEVLGDVVDPTRISFYGISQGHILGSTLFAYDPTLTRGAFSVGGANWAIMFERSKNWVAYGFPLKGAYGGVMNSVILQQVIEMAFEIVDGATVAPRLLAGGVPGAAPGKQYLHYMSVGDCQVPNLASELQARSIGLPLLAPAIAEPYGLVATPGPLANAFVIMDERPDPLPPESNLLFNYDNVAHENLRRRRATIDQIVGFFDAGEIVNTCSGACDCAAGACGPLP